ncbi:anti-sigma factor antagonist [Kitasatospora aburaviensis]
MGREGPVRIVTVAGELDHESADGLRSALARSVDEGIERILVDFGDLRFCDSTGLNLLLRARLDAEAAGVSLEIAGLQPVVSRLFAVTGVDTVLRIHSDLASALKASDAGPGRTTATRLLPRPPERCEARAVVRGPETDAWTAAGAERTRRLVLAGSEGAVQRSRDFSRSALLSWRWLPAVDEEQLAVAEDVLLMVSELITNACLHAPGGPGSCASTGTAPGCGWRSRTPARYRRDCSCTATPRGPAGTACGWWSGSPGPGARCPRARKLVWLEVPSPLDHRVRPN